MVGTRWFKCDLHLHTPASKCFRDQAVTPEQWVHEAIAKGLDCVAVTDHNTASWVDKVKKAAKETSLTVFPGVELTCSDAKVHLLIIFDVTATTQNIEDFLISASIERAQFGEQDAHSPKSIEEIVQLAKDKLAVCIPAHIDEYNGLGEVPNTPRVNFLENENVLAVQVVHKKMLEPESKNSTSFKAELLKEINRYFGVSEEDIIKNKLIISEDRVKNWRQSVLQSVKHEKAILTFSDNPHQPGDSKHGLAGIGTRYSWIKMDQTPSLESLRQALLLYKFRIRTDFECGVDLKPYKIPNIWIQKIKVSCTNISHPTEDFELEFSPQMNSIIGGRGSGKSSILQFIRGVFQRGEELNSLHSVHDEFKKFFQLPDRNKRGVLKSGCSIEVTIQRRDEVFKVSFLQSDNQIFEISKLNENTGKFEPVDNNFLNFLEFDIFSQKQIYEVATNLNSLRERIDESSNDIMAVKKELELTHAEYVKKSSAIRALKVKIQRKALLNAEITDVQNKIDKFKEVGIEQELAETQAFNQEWNHLKGFVEQIRAKAIEFEELKKSISVPSLNIEVIAKEKQASLKPTFEKINKLVAEVSEGILQLQEQYSSIPDILTKEIEKTSWNQDRKEASNKFDEKKAKLLEAGVDTIDQIQEDIKILERKKRELQGIDEIEREIIQEEHVKTLLKTEFIAKRNDLTRIRKEFLDDLLQGGNVRAKVQGCKDSSNLEDLLRTALTCQNSFDEDIKKLVEIWKTNSSEKANRIVFDSISSMNLGTYSSGGFSQRFLSKMSTLNGEQVDTIDLMFPEDEIQLEYKTQSGRWKPLSNVSAGQKTAAILSLIMSQGEKPLILDQPEDDLDNFLIYDLVVDQLRKSKESRQIITVTHNANIPVNGDSEYIIVMDSDSKHLKEKEKGSIEDPNIKQAICAIMEGGKEAFEMRSKRYLEVLK